MLDLSERTQKRLANGAVLFTLLCFIGTMILEYFADPLSKQAAKDVAFDFGFTVAIVAAGSLMLFGLLGGGQ